MLREKARFFVDDTVYHELSGSDFYQFSDADTNYWIFLKATTDCTVIRCGKNLMYPVGETPHVYNKDSVKNTQIMRAFSADFYKKILQYPRTYSMRVSENNIQNSGYFQFQETTKEYATGLVRIGKNSSGTSKTYIENTTSTFTNLNYYGSYYFAHETVSDGESVKLDQYMCAIGNDDVYEPYTAEIKTLSAGETVAVSALSGINTLFCSDGTLTVQYVQKKTEGNA